RGFGVLIPGKKLAPEFLQELYSKAKDTILNGLPRLIALSHGSAARLYSRYSGSFTTQHSTDLSQINNEQIQSTLKLTLAKVKTFKVESKLVGSDDYIKFVKGEQFECDYERENDNLFPDGRVTELIDIDRHTEMFSSMFSNYMVCKIPYSANWSLARIKRYVRPCNSKFRMNRHYGNFMNMDVARKLRPNRAAHDDEEEDDFDYAIPNCIEINESAESVLTAALSFVDKENDNWVLSQYSPTECWLIDNPGQQMLTGSFEPLFSTMQEWIYGTK
ncbi:hypothetical protein HDV01_004042, partial [Terramyces sp. JEL0728]